jgi:hypothetical protein
MEELMEVISYNAFEPFVSKKVTPTHDLPFRISNKVIIVRNIGGMKLRIILSTPRIYYFDNWE